MSVICIIPSRIASTRLPRKPLLPIRGKPMIQWTYENALRCKQLERVIVATDNEEIANVIQQLGGEVVFTDPAIPTGSERVATVAEKFATDDIIINLQGDEPFVRPSMLETLIEPFHADPALKMATLAYPIDPKKMPDPGTVKVILDKQNKAIYFSRSPIPYFRETQKVPVFNHMGIYAFRNDFLQHYTTLSQTPLELAEQLEQLRVIENGYSIHVCLTPHKTLEINTHEEYLAAQDFVYLA